MNPESPAETTENAAETLTTAPPSARAEDEERQRAEAYRNRLTAIIESSQDAIVSKDLNGIVTSWNAGAERIYGYPAAEIIGKSKSLVFLPDRLDELASILYRVRRGERIEHYDTVRRRKDGTLVQVSLSVSPVRDASGQIIGASTIARDITERVRADAERRRLMGEVAGHRQRVEDLISSVPGVVWEAWGEPDKEHQRINFVSDYVETMLGYTVAEWVSTPNFWLTIVHPDDKEKAARVAAEAWGRGGQHHNEFRWLRKDGLALWCEAYSVVIQDESGQPVGMRGVTIDVSERKQAELEKAKHLAEIETLNRQLQRAMTETHHRVRNNLQVIAALVEMQAAGANGTAEGFQQIGGHIRALAAVHDLLTEQAKKDSLATDISARAILLKLVELVRQTARDHRLAAHIADVRLSTRQGTSLAVAAYELLTNALKYGQSVIEIRFFAQNGKATLEIVDDGPGFPPDFHPEASASTGLILVSQIARWDLRAETLVFETGPEGGGRVRITIPLATEPPC